MSIQENKDFITHSYASKEEFISEYKKFYNEKTKAKELYLQILIELDKSISAGAIDNFKNLTDLINYIGSVESRESLKAYFNDPENPIENTNLVILACKYNKVQILKHVFVNKSILTILSTDVGKDAITPSCKDGTSHNAFYYAILSDNIEILDVLIKKWPDNYFVENFGELDKILSVAYEDLKLKNVPLSDKVELFVENHLINLRFFCKDFIKQVKSVDVSISNINERIILLHDSICSLNLISEVDEQFLFTVKFIAQNMYVLKRQLKITYERLPWEEVEFCLISFVSSHIKQQEINLFYHATLNRNKILKYLEHFVKQLKKDWTVLKSINFYKYAELPKLKRSKIVVDNIKNNSVFEELYKDYQQIRDIHSLEKISDYVKLALSADPKEKEGQLIIVRVLQVIGEYLKNTLESPKLSDTTGEILLLSLPKNAREIIVDLRNSLSHSYSLVKRMEIEENTNTNFFVNVQTDTKKIGDVIIDILYSNKIKIIANLLKKIVDAESLDEIEEIASIITKVKLDKILMKNDAKMMQHEKLEKLIEELSDKITDKTNSEIAWFNKIQEIINAAEMKTKNTRMDYYVACALFKSLMYLFDNKIDDNIIKAMKYYAELSLRNFAPKIEFDSLKEIVELTMKISQSIKFRLRQNNGDKITSIIYEIFYIVEFGTNDIKWIEKLKEKLNDKTTSIPQRVCKVSEEKYDNFLALKVEELKNILSNNLLSGQSVEKISLYKSNKKLQAVIEMLVLDIMSILDDPKHHLENNMLCLDDTTPLLVGKCLRNHLAHDNALIDVLSSDPSMAVILNAKKLTEEKIMENKKNIGKLVSDNPYKLREKYEEGLVTISNKKRMFIALEEGNLDILKDCIKKGTDIKARSIYNSWTAMHFAAKGPSLDVIKFISEKNLSVNVKDINGQSPLHIAAAYGRKYIIEFFVRKGLSVKEEDNSGKNALHIAAQRGHEDAVKFLLKMNSNSINQDIAGISPLFYAIRNNHFKVAKILLERDVNANINATLGGFSPLHQASERGNLELVNFLIENKANLNSKNDKNYTPLHAAVLNGHLEIVNILIRNKANVNSKVLDGCTPLHYAIESGFMEIANTLLEAGANVNAADKTYKNTPLHYAAKYGQEGFIEILLENNAKINITTIDGLTPLHFAVQSGNLKSVMTLIKNGSNIYAKDKTNATPLFFAAQNAHTEIAEFLIKNNAEINSQTIDKLTLLHVAALNGSVDMIELLIKTNAKINNKDNKGNTPLHFAASNGNKKVIDLLIKNKAEVNARAIDQHTPLHCAALEGNLDATILLIQNNAEINVKDSFNITPLHTAALQNHRNVVKYLIENKAEINVKGYWNSTPLYLAVESGHKEIVRILIQNGANVNIKSNEESPLSSAIKNNRIDIVNILIMNNANVNADGGESLSVAVLTGYKDILKMLIENGARIKVKLPSNITLLHIAVERGDIDIVNLLLENEANVNAKTVENLTPLYGAAQCGHEDILEILIAHGAEINTVCNEGTALHIAAALGYNNIVTILLNNGADINSLDDLNRIPIEIAAVRGHVGVVKILLKHKKTDINVKFLNHFTLLHIAAQQNNVEVVKYLIENRADIYATNESGSMPIHIAVREGKKDNVEFLLNNGSGINDLGASNQTLLHYAAVGGHLEVLTHLIELGADINSKDDNGMSPLHIAAMCGRHDVIKILLEHGAIYNISNNLNKKPLEYSKNENIVRILGTTQVLFAAVKSNNNTEVQSAIEAGAFVNAKNIDNGTALHYAAWKGFDKIVDVLLENDADPNAIGNKGFTPLHYASKFSHLKIAELLLSNGAIYNAVSNGGKTPSDLITDKSLTKLFDLIKAAFTDIENNDSQIINNLNKNQDSSMVKAIMNARNQQNHTLVVLAMQTNFTKIEQLKQIAQVDVSEQIKVGTDLLGLGQYQNALIIFKMAFEQRRAILGPDNPATLEIQTKIAMAFYKLLKFDKALKIYEEILKKQTQMLGANDTETLKTKAAIALVLYRQEKDDEALKIYEEVYENQKQLLGANHADTLRTQFHMAMVLNRQGKHQEALNINRAVYEQRKGENTSESVSILNNIAMGLSNLNKDEEALKMYRDVYEKKKKVFGVNHSDTFRTLHNIASILCKQKKYNEALKVHREVYDLQNNFLGKKHPDTLYSQYSIAAVLFNQGRFVGALKAYMGCFAKMKAVFGENHPHVLDIHLKINTINMKFKLDGEETSDIFKRLQEEINIAASNGDIKTVKRLLEDGIDVNDTDIDGRTPLHFAVSNMQIGVVNFLLNNKADVTKNTNKGNTPLLTAVLKGYQEIVEILLEHVNHNNLSKFVNGNTIATGTTSLHIAAKSGHHEIVKSLLKRGAIYNIKNKDGKTPLDLSKDSNVNNLLKLIEELFKYAKKGNYEIINELEMLRNDEFLAVVNARNNGEITLLQVAIANKHKNVVKKLLEMIQISN